MKTLMFVLLLVATCCGQIDTTWQLVATIPDRDEWILERVRIDTVQVCDTIITPTPVANRFVMEINCRKEVVRLVLWKVFVPTFIDVSCVDGLIIRKARWDERVGVTW